MRKDHLKLIKIQIKKWEFYSSYELVDTLKTLLDSAKLGGDLLLSIDSINRLNQKVFDELLINKGILNKLIEWEQNDYHKLNQFIEKSSLLSLSLDDRGRFVNFCDRNFNYQNEFNYENTKYVLVGFRLNSEVSRDDSISIFLEGSTDKKSKKKNYKRRISY